MDTFRWISVVFSMIIGLGVARLLASAAAVFRARRHARLDWLPLLWAALIFFQLLSFWWSLEELSSIIPEWTFVAFLLVVSLTITLFLAATLVLPPSELEEGLSLRRFFEQDGRFGLLALAAFNGLAVLVNHIFWRDTIFAAGEVANLLLCLLPVIAFAAPRPVQAGATLAYLPIGVLSVLSLVPSSY
jgi:hypothetical protein